METDLRVGDVAIVFDSKLWGGKDQGNNSQFFKPATILEIYPYGFDAHGRPRNERLATVRFHHDGRISKGHFVDMMSKEIPS
jgi:hypothetical protein